MVEDVKGILHTVRLLLDAMELSPMPEPVFLVICERFPFFSKGPPFWA